MYGFTESFNISNSAAIILSHFVERMHRSNVQWQLSDEEKAELYFEWLQKTVKDPDGLIRHYYEKNHIQQD
jgi:tRNA (guanosine-2'-O-)-methyltransferase